MATKDAVIAGAFALSGVTLQQLISTTISVIHRRRDNYENRRKERQELYGRSIAQARRVQRLLKESVHAINSERESEIGRTLTELAETNAQIRLIAPRLISEAVTDLEDSMRKRYNSPETRDVGPLPLGPIIETLRKDLGVRSSQ